MVEIIKRYSCDVCSLYYNNFAEAQKCEERGIIDLSEKIVPGTVFRSNHLPRFNETGYTIESADRFVIIEDSIKGDGGIIGHYVGFNALVCPRPFNKKAHSMNRFSPLIPSTLIEIRDREFYDVEKRIAKAYEKFDNNFNKRITRGLSSMLVAERVACDKFEVLNGKLQEAIDEENYERAASLRSELLDEYSRLISENPDNAPRLPGGIGQFISKR